MNTKRVEELLSKHNLRKTKIRKGVLHLFLDDETLALSENDLEQQLASADRVTLYRTLKTFEQKGIIHQAVDSSGKAKYALCDEHCDEHQHADNHAHFHCYSCGRTICLDDTRQPAVHLPSGYELHKAHFVLEGACDRCSQQNGNS